MAYQSQDDDAQSRKLIRFNMDYIFMLSVPILFGMFVYGDDIIRLLFEPEMMPAVSSLVILTFIIPIQAVRRLLRQQVLLPRDRDRVILVITIISIVSNVLLNLLLVPRYYHVGAAAATLVVEFVDMALALVYISVVFKMNLFALRHLKYVIAGAGGIDPVLLLCQRQGAGISRTASDSCAECGLILCDAFFAEGLHRLQTLHEDYKKKITALTGRRRIGKNLLAVDTHPGFAFPAEVAPARASLDFWIFEVYALY